MSSCPPPPFPSSTSSSSVSASTPHHSSSSAAPAACAACKHQRRKCTPECILAPYFPAERPAQFQNAHRLFGIKNILRILDRVGPAFRDAAMHTIIYESNARAADPVRGCYGIVQDLQRHLHQASADLAAAHHHLALLHHHHAPPPNDPLFPAEPLPPIQEYAPYADDDIDITFSNRNEIVYGDQMGEAAAFVMPSLDVKMEAKAAAFSCEGSTKNIAAPLNPPPLPPTAGSHLNCRLGLGFYDG